MATIQTPERPVREVNFNLRASREQRALIDRAAAALGKSRSDFMLQAARQEAESVLLDRRYFALDASSFKKFSDMLDTAPTNNPQLRHLLNERAPWEP